MTGPDRPSGSKPPSDRDHPDNGYFPEDERSPLDHEDDHSDTAFDLHQELDSRLGQAGPVELDHDSRPPLRIDPVNGNGHYFPEDEHSPAEHEDDHSMADFDLQAEIEAVAAKKALNEGQDPDRQAAEQAYLDDDDHSPLEHEDDHSTAEFDLNQEIEARLGPQDEDALAASREAGMAYQRLIAAREIALDPAERAAAARNVDAVAVDDDSHSPLDSEGESADYGDEIGLVIRPAARIAQPGSADGQDAGNPTRPGEAAGSTQPAANNEPLLSGGVPEGEAIPDSREHDPVSRIADQGKLEVEPDAPEGDVPGGFDRDEEFSPDDPEEDDQEEDEPEEEEKDGDRPMTLRDHLVELRKRLLYAFLFALGGFFVCWPFAETIIFPFLFDPLVQVMPEGSKLIFTSPPEAFFTYLKIAFVAGIFLASPLIFYQIWAFVAPGLYREEKMYLLPVTVFSAFFFISGAAFCYYVVFDFIFTFFMSYNQGVVQAMPKLNESLGFVLQLLLAFGLVFELPLFVFFLARIGLVTADKLRRFRRYAVLFSVIVGALLTPPDVVSQLLMAGPLVVLYEISILIAAAFGKKKPPMPEEDDEIDDEDPEIPDGQDATAGGTQP